MVVSLVAQRQRQYRLVAQPLGRPARSAAVWRGHQHHRHPMGGAALDQFGHKHRRIGLAGQDPQLPQFTLKGLDLEAPHRDLAGLDLGLPQPRRHRTWLLLKLGRLAVGRQRALTGLAPGLDRGHTKKPQAGGHLFDRPGQLGNPAKAGHGRHRQLVEPSHVGC